MTTTFRTKPIIIEGEQKFMIQELVHSFLIWYRWRDYYPVSTTESFIGTKEEVTNAITHLQSGNCY